MVHLHLKHDASTLVLSETLKKLMAEKEEALSKKDEKRCRESNGGATLWLWGRPTPQKLWDWEELGGSVRAALQLEAELGARCRAGRLRLVASPPAAAHRHQAGRQPYTRQRQCATPADQASRPSAAATNATAGSIADSRIKMDKYAKMWASQKNTSNSSQSLSDNEDEQTHPRQPDPAAVQPVVNARSTTVVAAVQRVVEEPLDIFNLPADPTQRRPTSQFKTTKVRDDVRRAYLQKGPFQPRNHSFPQTDMSGISRHFNPARFSTYGGWLEYSIDEDAVYCLCCYLFQNETRGHGGGDAFSSKGWRLWNKASRLQVHVGGPSSVHNQNMKRC
ncbi:hypothetical protein ACQ4PT_004449 [Festuca glaucescens]